MQLHRKVETRFPFIENCREWIIEKLFGVSLKTSGAALQKISAQMSLIDGNIQTLFQRLGMEDHLQQSIECFKKENVILQKLCDFTNEEDQNPYELHLIEFLLPWLKHKTVVDIGAFRGHFLKKMLSCGFKKILAFEPNEPLYKILCQTYQSNPNIKIFPFALSNSDRNANLHLVKFSNTSPNPTSYRLLSTLNLNPVFVDAQFYKKIPVVVRSFRSLIEEKILPSHIGLLKIDTEGHELFVLQGMPADYPCEIIFHELWGKHFIDFKPRQEDFVKQMREMGYAFSISLGRYPDRKVRFIANASVKTYGVWGNTFYFRDQILFEKAYKFIQALMPQAAQF